MAGALEHKVEKLKEQLRSLLYGAAFAGWTGLWGLLALIGWIGGLAGLLTTSLYVLGGSWLGMFGFKILSNRRLKRLAETHLAAQAKLDKLPLDHETESTLKLFDLAYTKVLAQLDQPGFDEANLGLTVQIDLDRAREHLYKLTKVEVALKKDLKEMGGLSDTRPVDAAIESTKNQVREIDEESNEIVQNAQKIADRVTEVRKLLGAGETVDDTVGRLKDVVTELDTTASAYREIDETGLKAAQKRLQQLRKQSIG